MITAEEFLTAAKKFVLISNKICDGWKLIENEWDINQSYISKETFIECGVGDDVSLLKAEYIIFYNLSYGVPSFSFNIWNSSGMLLSLEDVRQLSFISTNPKEFYSIITQQEHPLFQRPYFIMHPCHTEELLTSLQDKTANVIVTFLGLVTPLIQLKLPLEYGLKQL
ncbi:ubiquitin-like-conjugating enzyme ATG10 [Manduca sexta]|uniref:Ubiquitin-like-conjugating enzyme ATG10 n=1 Tax=Manduca sexta TaxID=7130 RepID=A0A921ZDE3_MANSE|nr:ubiquitin-like-conjugating enzyme ATG10 [Manduca sexta]KAG6455500.1 hypothetical protein O3G_MSEX009238 [Manduca sexta]